ncbi:MAG: rod shape-determining protein MreC [Verrucomicrobiales bacterium]|jgi:rod shape-determining protein MreC|nr:rod shape-determining protein MreC [Verrucomicrobiales bacterium]
MSRPILFIGGAVVVLLAVGGFFLPKAAQPAVEKISVEGTSPIWRALDWVKSGYKNVSTALQTAEKLQQDNRRLVVENARLATENSLWSGLELENRRLREMLAFKNDAQFKLLPARVIERDPSSWWNVIKVNRGWSDDPTLTVDQPVVSPRGVVGKTGAVGKYATNVILLVDENCKISSVTESSQARGIIVGATSLNSGVPLCKITFVPRDTPLAVGERVFTSGLGGIFPANLLIGTVKEAPALSTAVNFGLYREGVIEPAVDLNNLEEVFIITGGQ